MSVLPNTETQRSQSYCSRTTGKSDSAGSVLPIIETQKSQSDGSRTNGKSDPSMSVLSVTETQKFHGCGARAEVNVSWGFDRPETSSFHSDAELDAATLVREKDDIQENGAVAS